MKLPVLAGVTSENGIYGHSCFATPILTTSWLAESIRRLNGILFPRLDEFRA